MSGPLRAMISGARELLSLVRELVPGTGFQVTGWLGERSADPRSVDLRSAERVPGSRFPVPGSRTAEADDDPQPAARTPEPDPRPRSVPDPGIAEPPVPGTRQTSGTSGAGARADRAPVPDELRRRVEAWLEAVLADEAPPGGLDADLLAEIGIEHEVPGSRLPVPGFETGASARNQEPGTRSPEPGPRIADRYSLWSAMTALAGEVKLQGRSLRELARAVDPLRDVAADVERLVARLAGAPQGRGEAGERERGAAAASDDDDAADGGLPDGRETVELLVDLRERLGRGQESARRAMPRSGDDGGAAPGAGRVAHALEQGYRLGLERLDEALERLGVREIEARDRPFDPHRMRAVAVERRADRPDGAVLEVVRAGYAWRGELLRPAEVKVARAARLHSTGEAE